MLAGNIPRAKRRKKLIIGVITTCCATCTLIHMMFHRICRVCIIGPTVIAWAYQFVGMLPVSMCYTGDPCGTLKCALLTTIAMPNVVPTSFFLFTHSTMPSTRCVVWTGILAFMHTSGDLGTTFLHGSSRVSCVGGGVAEHFLLDPAFPYPSLNPPLPSEFHPPPLSGFHLPPF